MVFLRQDGQYRQQPPHACVHRQLSLQRAQVRRRTETPPAFPGTPPAPTQLVHVGSQAPSTQTKQRATEGGVGLVQGMVACLHAN